jgi:hypothetical protein
VQDPDVHAAITEGLNRSEPTVVGAHDECAGHLRDRSLSRGAPLTLRDVELADATDRPDAIETCVTLGGSAMLPRPDEPAWPRERLDRMDERVPLRRPIELGGAGTVLGERARAADAGAGGKR